MNNEQRSSLFNKALLTGVFVGFATTIICLIYNIVYRDYSGFTPSEIINVSSLIFAINILFTIIGVLYYFFLSFSRQGNLLFISLFAILTVVLLWKTAGIQRSSVHEIAVQFRGLLGGIVLISGIAAAFVLPFLFHSKSFERNVL
jgi:hypothetical protein